MIYFLAARPRLAFKDQSIMMDQNRSPNETQKFIIMVLLGGLYSGSGWNHLAQ